MNQKEATEICSKGISVYDSLSEPVQKLITETFEWGYNMGWLDGFTSGRDNVKKEIEAEANELADLTAERLNQVDLMDEICGWLKP